MRTQFLVTAVLGLAVAGCGECQPVLVSLDASNIESRGESNSDSIPFSVIETTEDGSRVVQYEVEFARPQHVTSVDSSGQETVRTEMVSMVAQRLATVPPGEDISKFLRVHVDGEIRDHEPEVRFDEYVDPAPAPPEPPDAIINSQLQVLTSLAASTGP